MPNPGEYDIAQVIAWLSAFPAEDGCLVYAYGDTDTRPGEIIVWHPPTRTNNVYPGDRS